MKPISINELGRVWTQKQFIRYLQSTQYCDICDIDKEDPKSINGLDLVWTQTWKGNTPKPVTEEAETYLNTICSLIDAIICSDYNSMTAEAQQNTDTLAYLVGETPGCYVSNSDKSVWSAKYDEPEE